MKHREENPLHLRIVIISLGGLVASLVLLIVSQNLEANINPPWIKTIIETVGSTLMVAATLGLLLEYTTKRDLLNMLEETNQSVSSQIRAFKALDELGLIDAYSDVNSFSFDELLLSSTEFIAVMNDGRGWVTRNAGKLRERLLIPNRKTTIILQHPESLMIEVLADKVLQSKDFLKEKISDTVKEMCSYPRGDNHELKIVGHPFFNVHSLFITEKIIVHTPYLISPGGRNTIPIFIFEKRGQGSLYQRWYADVEHLLRFVQPLSENGKFLENKVPNP